MTIDQNRMKQVADAYTAAWNSGSADGVAQFYAPDGRIVINRGRPWEGRAGVAAMAAGFYADVPDLHLTCDGVRSADDHAVFLWTYTGTDARTGQPVRVSGWEEWDVDEDLKVQSSCGWFPTAPNSPQTT
ncbi:MAG TPA: nuclear transport factor 2 family protein [Candidatus Limnocylindria bacterium]|nr:nuclear transport factor 2 family protein [Candidatus Limnocylindria bacterium]